MALNKPHSFTPYPPTGRHSTREYGEAVAVAVGYGLMRLRHTDSDPSPPERVP